MKQKVAIFGSKGFVGEELLRILSTKEQVEIVEVFRDQDLDEALFEVGYALLALPAEESMKLVPRLLKRKMYIIDLSGAFRLKDVAVFERYYGIPHSCPEYLDRAVYGLTEKNRDEIYWASLVSNPGCYATAIELAMLPLVEYGFVDKHTQIIVEAISGYTGAGKNVKIPSEVNPYKPDRMHQHIPEIEQTLGLDGQLHFFPHIAPWPRGIEAKIKLNMTRIDIFEFYIKYYSFLARRVSYVNIDTEARRENVIGTNLCQIFPKINKHGEAEIAVAIDNLGKGAAGQAVQNLITINPFFGEKIYTNEWLPY